MVTTPTPWLYRAYVERIVDGDTIDVTVDMGFQTRRTIRLRLDGIDTAETWGVSHDSEEYALGMDHKRFVEDWLVESEETSTSFWPLLVRTFKDEKGKYGRYVARVIRQREDGVWDFETDLNDALVQRFGDVVRSV